MASAYCSSCVDGGLTWVFRTAGGSEYHTRPDCEWLSSGTRRTHRRGLNDQPIESVSLAEAEAYLYQPCTVCSQTPPLAKGA